MGRAKRSKRRPLASQRSTQPAENKGNDQQYSSDESRQHGVSASEAENQNTRPNAPDHATPSQQNPNYERAIARWTFAVGLFTGALVLANGYSAYILQETDITLKETMVYGQRAIVISNTLRFITYDAPVEDNEKAVGVGSRRWLVAPRIENVGNTPTVNMHFGSSTGLSSSFTDDVAFDKFKATNLAISPAGTVGPKSDFVPGGLQFSNIIFTGSWGIGAIGIIRYQDIFGNFHLSEYCYHVLLPPIDFNKFPVGQPVYVGGFSCAHHNCIDDECGADWLDRAKGAAK